VQRWKNGTQPALSAAPDMVMGNENTHVLLVDDDIGLALMYQELLQAHGYEVSTAADGQQDLKALKTGSVEAIICDLSMPELSGDLFYREVGLAYPELLKRFIFLTANADHPLYERFLKTISAPVLAKPATIERLLEQLAVVLSSPRPVANPPSPSNRA
jgi:CheY-like chemotaxis protein